MFARITSNPSQMNGEPCICNLRIPVATIVTMLAQRHTAAQILQFYHDLEQGDIEAALNYTAESVREKKFPSRKPDEILLG